MNAQGPPSLLEAYCGLMNKAEEWIFDAKTAHIPKQSHYHSRMSIKVPIPGEEIPIKIAFHTCRSCGLVAGIEDGTKAHCPYDGCGGELMQMEGE